MRRFRVRFAAVIPWALGLTVLACCVPMLAPGFTLRGDKRIELLYPDDLTVSGGYPSIWRLRFDRVTVGKPIRPKLALHRGLPLRPTKPTDTTLPDATPLDINHPLSITLNGQTHGVGRFTPDLVQTLGGQLHADARGFTTGWLPLHSATGASAGSLRLWFVDDRPVALEIHTDPDASGPTGIGLTYNAGSVLHLPATETAISRAFGLSSRREKHFVMPDNRPQSLAADMPFL